MLISTECMLEHNSFYNHHHHHHRIESIVRKFLIDWIIEILFHFNGNVKRTIIGARYCWYYCWYWFYFFHCFWTTHHRWQQHLNFDLTYVPRGYTYYDKKIRIDRNPIRTALNVCKQLISKKVRELDIDIQSILIIIEIIFNQQTEFHLTANIYKIRFNLCVALIFRYRRQ